MSSLLDNLAIKIAALVLGLLLWFHVATEKEYSYELKLPVTDVVLDSGLTLSRYPPDSCLVVVSATGKRLLRRQWRQQGLRINAGQFPAGRHNLVLSKVNTSLPGASNLVSLEEVVTPNATELHIDHKSERRVPVRLDFKLLPDEGYAVRSISPPIPDEVVVTGARSLLASLQDVATEQTRIAHLRDNISLTLKLLKPPGYGIGLYPDSVSVDIEVVPVRTRVLEEVPIVVFNVPPGKSATTSPAMITVTVTGPPAEIDNLAPASVVASIDYRTIDADYRAAIKTDCPPHLSIKQVSSDSVEVLVN